MAILTGIQVVNMNGTFEELLSNDANISTVGIMKGSQSSKYRFLELMIKEAKELEANKMETFLDYITLVVEEV